MTGEAEILRSRAALRAKTALWRRAGARIALVPTMGALHAGHVSLVERAAASADHVVVSIFVNPTQFAPSEDLAAYPRSFETDAALLAGRRVAAIYAPSVEDIYPEGFATGVVVAGPAEAGLEDRFRPHFFRGVATVVAKLLIQSACDVAVFGEKDFQQLRVVERLVADLDLPCQIIPGPTVRDEDGLALSSRNRYLSAEDRRRATTLPRVMQAVVAALRRGENVGEALVGGEETLAAAGFTIDYLALRRSATLEPAGAAIEGPLRLLCAARIGATRLIDNMPVE